jgi:hypothetical protein
MALQRMILVPPELWENRCKTPTPPPPVKEILNSKDNSYDKWNRVQIHHTPLLNTEKRRELIAVPILERKTGNPKRVLPVETGSSSYIQSIIITYRNVNYRTTLILLYIVTIQTVLLK